MDDDGLQMNFAVPTQSAQGAVAASVFGVGKGSWKKKRIVNKIAKSKAEKTVVRDNRRIDTLSVDKTPKASEASVSFIKGGQGKKVWGSVAVKAPANRVPNAASSPRNLTQQNTGNNSNGQKKNASFVSSLFSGNPSLDSIRDPAEIDSAALPKQLSNAVPIASDTNSFAGLGLNPLLIAHLSGKMGVDVPTMIQRATLAALVPPAQGALGSASSFTKDALVQAQTGSGKTLAYLLPIVHCLIQAQTQCSEAEQGQLNRSLGTVAIVLAPTRELAKQIYAVLELLLKYSSSTGSGGANAKSSIDKSDNEVDDDEDSEGDDTAASQPHTSTSSPSDKSKPSRHWIVPGLVVGGDKKKSEKARLRKGCTILVSTPGRLIDHLKTTRAFEIGNLRWLVLDEADRFLELGFEETLRELLSIIDDKRKTCVNIQKRLKAPCWPAQKQILLTSATIKGNVQRLAETSLRDPLFIKAAEEEDETAKKAKAAEDSFDLAKKASRGKDYIVKKKKEGTDDESDDDFWDQHQSKANDGNDVSDLLTNFTDVAPAGTLESQALTISEDSDEEMFNVPEQLKQTYVLVPAKLRLVTLVALLRQISSRGSAHGGFKAILFADTCDGVDFLYHILANGHKGPSRDEAEVDKAKPNLKKDKPVGKVKNSKPNANGNDKIGAATSEAAVESSEKKDSIAPPTSESLTSTGVESPLFPSTAVFKLHGNLSQKVRELAYSGFKRHTHSLLICTDVAARGLDLPDISFVIQYDMPSDVKDYVHRIGRTARLGRNGSAVSLLLPSEAKYVDLLKRKGVVVKPEDGMAVLKYLVGAPVEGLNGDAVDPAGKEKDGGKGRKPKKRSLEDWATDVQMMFERFVMADEQNLELARTAFRSHVRAYTTHVSSERQLFNIKNLHLGHVAKSFALRDAPGMAMGAPSASNNKKKGGKDKPESNGSTPNLKRKAYQLQSKSAAASEFGDGGVQKLTGGMRKKFKNMY
ncbi:P-loop containing nucleoside triphosphate hydrolase protein [Chytriomyces sp. MP71]|nr:P-loop containing nucleoside triphosphate hydrolase protein [Chytriomyces sp. MP71]